jgi:3'(2'), 5'-bisphosphate nucleotidase
MIEQRMQDNQVLLDSVIQIATEAGSKISEIYHSGNFDTKYKSDKSPVTRADLQADKIISKLLNELTPNVPIISEESLKNISSNEYVGSKVVWMVDPLDGTRDFINHNDEFTVNIALIENGDPVLGVVLAPVMDQLYFASKGSGAYKKTNGKITRMLTTAKISNIAKVTISRSHHSQRTQDWIASLNNTKIIQLGSSLKLCYLADSKADIYPKLSPIMEWDIAAADAILREAGGVIIETQSKKQPTYNKRDLKQPNFIAFSKSSDVDEYLINHWQFDQ